MGMPRLTIPPQWGGMVPHGDDIHRDQQCKLTQYQEVAECRIVAQVLHLAGI